VIGIPGIGYPCSSDPWASCVGDMPDPARGPEHALQLALPSTGRLPPIPGMTVMPDIPHVVLSGASRRLGRPIGARCARRSYFARFRVASFRELRFKQTPVGDDGVYFLTNSWASLSVFGYATERP
jgi:hypothetical protein